jgi:hypothetical protein
VTRTTLRVLLWLASALAVAGYLALAWRTLAGGAAADPVEASILEHAARFTQGQSLYGEPHDGGVPLMPVFPIVVSWLVQLFDAGVWGPRLASLLATLLTAIVVGSVVRSETHSATLGMTAAGLLLMSQGAATDVTAFARPEPLMLLLVIVGCQELRYAPGVFGALLASLLFGAACFTHPAGLVFALAALLHLGLHDHRRLIAYGLGLAALVCAAQLALSQALGPWFNYAAWDAALQAMRFAPTTLLKFVGTQLLGTLGVFTLATVLTFALPIPPWRGAVGIWTWMAFAALVAGIVTTQGGSAPGEAMRATAMILAIVGPVSAQRVTQHLSNWPGGSRMGGHAVVLTALALQFVTLFASGAP